MRIIFFGTPDFAIPSLKVLLENNFEVVAVVTVPDSEQGRGLKKSFSPIKKFTLENNLKVIQPENLSDELFTQEVKSLNPDLGIVVAFKILPPTIYKIPKLGTFNLHGSLLPKYRGAAPIQWALINGDKETGLTTFFLEDKVDTGNIIAQIKLPISFEDNFETLHDKMSLKGAELVLQTVKLIESSNYVLQSQDNSLATQAKKITKELCHINWNNSANVIYNLIRGLSPIPCSYSMLDDKVLKIYKSTISENISNKTPGKIEIIDNKIFVNTIDNKIILDIVQLEGKKKLSTSEFLRGFRIENSSLLLT